MSNVIKLPTKLQEEPHAAIVSMHIRNGLLYGVYENLGQLYDMEYGNAHGALLDRHYLNLYNTYGEVVGETIDLFKTQIGA